MSPTEDGRRMLKVSDVAALLAMDEKHVYRMLAHGTIPSYKLGRSVRVAPSDMDEYLASVRS